MGAYVIYLYLLFLIIYNIICAHNLLSIYIPYTHYEDAPAYLAPIPLIRDLLVSVMLSCIYYVY
jgi:hypothetical protein